MGIWHRALSDSKGRSESDPGIQRLQHHHADRRRGCAGTDAESCAVHQLHCRRFPGDHVSDPHRRKPQQSGQPVDLPPGGSAGSGRCCCAGVREECQGVFWQITAGNRKSQRQNGEYFSWFSSFGSQCLSNFFYRTADGR